MLAKSCLTLCDPMDCSLPGSSVHGILQARILEWVAMPSSRGIFPTQGVNPHLLWLLHCRQILYCWATREALDVFWWWSIWRRNALSKSLAAQRSSQPLLCLNFGDWLNQKVFSFLVGGAFQPPIASTVQNSLMWMWIVYCQLWCPKHSMFHFLLQVSNNHQEFYSSASALWLYLWSFQVLLQLWSHKTGICGPSDGPPWVLPAASAWWRSLCCFLFSSTQFFSTSELKSFCITLFSSQFFLFFIMKFLLL